MKQLTLDIGAGTEGRGDVNVDIRPLPGVDVVCNALQLPFKNGTFSRITMNLVLEHFSYPDVLRLLKEAKRVLKEKGIVEVWVPNFQAFGHLKAWLLGGVDYANPQLPQLYAPMTGLQDYKENVHLSQWSIKLLKIYFTKVGLRVVKAESPFANYKGFYILLYLILSFFPKRRGIIHLIAQKG